MNTVTVPRHLACVSVLISDETHAPAATQLATRLGLALFRDEAAAQAVGNYVLEYRWHADSQETRLQIRDITTRPPSPVDVDFVHGPLQHRRLYGGGRNQPLARAVGLKAGQAPTMIDATGGLGRDAFVLASLGARVTLLERSPIVATLLADGLQRAAGAASTATIIAGLTLIVADGCDYLQHLAADQRPDVIYLDPMYPHRNKSALVKKEMRVLRDVVGDDADVANLLQAALRAACKRVVVKRPAGADALPGPAPMAAIHSPNTRYDLYNPTLLSL